MVMGSSWSSCVSANAAMRIVVVTDADSFASVIVALRAGADDYIAQPVGEDELVDALLDRAPVLPPVPDMPLGLSRTCWEHVMRIYEQCDRNVTPYGATPWHAPALPPAHPGQAGAAAASADMTLTDGWDGKSADRHVALSLSYRETK